MIGREHPQRRSIVDGMHLRRWPVVTDSTQVIQILRLVADEERDCERELLGDLEAASRHVSGDGVRHLSGQLASGSHFAWERHTEASAFALFFHAETSGTVCSDLPEIAFADRMPGEIVRATRIHVLPDETSAEALVATLDFNPEELVTCRVGDGVRLWSDFKIGADGFGRLVIAANDVERSDLGRVVQSLQELGNYRNLALLGLPIAQRQWTELDAIENALADFARKLCCDDYSDDDLLEEVSRASMQLMSISATTRYRMSATAAYAQLVRERLAELLSEKIPGFQSLTDFTQRRLLPAERTCAAHSRREADLTERAANFTALLRARIETRIESQNARVLESLDRSAGLQVRLQQLVEGFSVIALSYYAVGLLSYVVKGLEVRNHSLRGHEWLAAVAFTMPIVIGLLLHRLRKSALGALGSLPAPASSALGAPD